MTVGESVVFAVTEPTFSSSGNTSYCTPTSVTIVSIKDEDCNNVKSQQYKYYIRDSHGVKMGTKGRL